MAIGLLFFSCKKSPDINTINVSSENIFYSSELGDVIGTHAASSQAVFDLIDYGYEHYLVLYRNKDISSSDDLFRKFVYGATSLTNVDVSLNLGQLELVSQEEDNYISYNFSNDFETIINDGVPTEKLPQNSFDKVSFEFNVGKEIYQGNFLEPSSLKDLNTTPNIPSLFINEIKTINWKPAQGNEHIKIHINHHSTINGPTRLPTKVITVDDSGSFDITPEVLADYLAGDVISIRLSRDVFIKANKLLIRSVEEQNWGPIELL